MRSLFLLCLATAAAAAPCPIYNKHQKVLTGEGAAIAEGGGFVIVTSESGEPAEPSPVWKLDGKPATVEHVAPGLDVVRGAGALGDGKKTIHGKAAGAAPLLDAPKVSDVKRNAPAEARHPYVQTIATFAGNAPQGAIGVVVFDAGGKAVSWGTQTERSAIVFSSGGCGYGVGAVDSPIGAKVTLAYLDASGRLGKKSAPVTVN